MNGSEIILECLIEQGVDIIFGYPGGAVLNIYDALHYYMRDGKLKHILTAHEQGAAHAADGYARSTGKVGVCMATSGPGAANLITGIATAYQDSSAVVFITGSVNNSLAGTDAFQELDIISITAPITKFNYRVRDVKELADVLREGFAVARSGRHGPVLIDIPKDVTASKCDYEFLPVEKHFTRGRLANLKNHPAIKIPEPNLHDINDFAEKLNNSKRPLLVCGGGVRNASKEFRDFAEKLNAPVAVTVMGCGYFPSEHILNLGMMGMHGSQASNRACDLCDLILAVGCRFSDRLTLAPKDFAAMSKTRAQIDIDACELGKNIRLTNSILGDAKKILPILTEKISSVDRSSWKNYVLSLKNIVPEKFSAGDGYLSSKEIFQAVAETLPDDIIVTTDVGQHQIWTIQNLKFSYPGQFITSGGMGTMGFGLGAAIGAKLGNPNKKVLHITSDGSFFMNCNELCTENYYNLPIITLVFNNSGFGMMRQWQDLIYEGRYYYGADRNADFSAIAKGYGLAGRRVYDVESLRSALREAANSEKGFVIDCSVNVHENLTPMTSGSIDHFVLN